MERVRSLMWVAPGGASPEGRLRALPDGTSPHQRSAPRATTTKPAEDRFVESPFDGLLAMRMWGFSHRGARGMTWATYFAQAESQ